MATISTNRYRPYKAKPLHQAGFHDIPNLLEIYYALIADTQNGIKLINRYQIKGINFPCLYHKQLYRRKPSSIDNNLDLPHSYNYIRSNSGPQDKRRSFIHTSKYRSLIISSSSLLEDNNIRLTYIPSILPSFNHNEFEWNDVSNLYRQSLQIYQRLFREDGLPITAIIKPMAIADQNLSNFDKVLVMLQAFLHIQLQLLENYFRILVKKTLINCKIAATHNKENKFSGTIPMDYESLNIFYMELDDLLLCIARLYDDIGSLYKEQSRLKDALLMHQQCQDIQLKVFGPNHLQIAATYDKIGSAFMEIGKLEEALFVYRKSLDIRIYVLNTDLLIATSYNNIIRVLIELGRYSEALSMQHELLPIQLQLVQNDQVRDIYSNNYTTDTYRSLS